MVIRQPWIVINIRQGKYNAIDTSTHTHTHKYTDLGMRLNTIFDLLKKIVKEHKPRNEELEF